MGSDGDRTTKVTLRRRLRPLRLAAVIPAGDRAEFRRTIQLFSLQWGGKYNFILPTRGRSRGEREMGDVPLSRILRAIEPDFVVTGKVQAKSLRVREDELKALGKLLAPGDESLGVDMVHVLRWRYNQDFRYVLRDPIELRTCKAPPQLSLFAAACFGEAPPHRRVQMDSAFAELGGKVEPLTAESFPKVWTSCVTPLRLCASRIEIGRARRTAFMVLDPQSVEDLADFWNLRALGWKVWPVPLVWTESAANAVSGFIRVNHQASSSLRAVATEALIFKGNSVSETVFQQFLRKVDAPKENFSILPMVPRIGGASPFGDLYPPALSAKDDEISMDLKQDGILFSGLEPEFDIGYAGNFSTATVVVPQAWDAPDLATTYPKGIADPQSVLRGFGERAALQIHSEGIVAISRGSSRLFHAQLPRGLDIFKGWLAPNWNVELSDAGKLARRMLDVMGGPERGTAWTRPAVVRLFEEINRKPSKAIGHAEFLNRLEKALVRRSLAEFVSQEWLARGVTALGLLVQCTKCGQRNWLGSAEAFRKVKCEHCLDQFDFPSLKPEKGATWAIRPLGPFSVEQQARGSFAVAAALRFLLMFNSRREAAWTPSVLLTKGSQSCEVDFMMLRPNGHVPGEEPLLLLGECKTFGVFEEDDIRKMARLGREFPEAVLVFAKLGKGLQAAERRHLAKLARLKSRTNPLLILTDTEITSDFGVVQAWSRGTDEERAFARGQKPYEFDLLKVCAATVDLRL